MDFYVVVLNLCANSFRRAFRINTDFYSTLMKDVLLAGDPETTRSQQP